MTKAEFLSSSFGGLAAIILAVASAVTGFGFGFNGSQYGSWVVVFLAIALVLFAAAVLFFLGRLSVRPNGRRVGAMLVLLSIVAGLAKLTTVLFPDSDPGSTDWPHTLAWLGLALFVVALPTGLSLRLRAK